MQHKEDHLISEILGGELCSACVLWDFVCFFWIGFVSLPWACGNYKLAVTVSDSQVEQYYSVLLHNC